MRRIIVILSVLVLAMSSCNKNKERPYEYDESKNLYTGAFAVSPDYFAEIIGNPETDELTVLINGHKTSIEFPVSDRGILEPAAWLVARDFNEDGYVDFCFTPNCTAKYPPSYTYYFDKDKEHFILVSTVEGGTSELEDSNDEEIYTNNENVECEEVDSKRKCIYTGMTLQAVYERVYIEDKEDLQKYMKFSLPSNDLRYEMIYSEGEKANDSISIEYHYSEENNLTVSFLTDYGGEYYSFQKDGDDTIFKYDYHD